MPVEERLPTTCTGFVILIFGHVWSCHSSALKDTVPWWHLGMWDRWRERERDWEPLSDVRSPGTFILDFPLSRTVKSKFIVFINYLVYFVIELWTSREGVCHRYANAQRQYVVTLTQALSSLPTDYTQNPRDEVCGWASAIRQGQIGTLSR